MKTLQISYSLLQPEHLDVCDRLWLDRAAYTAGERREFRQLLGALLKAGRVRGTLITDGDMPRACGVSAFVEYDWVQREVRAPQPLLGKRLVLSASDRCSPVLTRDQIASGNSGAGLALVVLGQGHDLTEGTRAELPIFLATFIQAFLQIHRGYSVNRMTNEVFGELGIAAVEDGQIFPTVIRLTHRTSGGQALPSAIFDLTREQAFARNSPILPLFVHHPPKCYFTEAEQFLLALSLAGRSDEGLAEALALSVTAVKARWKRIYERAERCVPHIFSEVVRRSETGRGSQLRHLLLEYLRNHPSELTPHVRRSLDKRHHARPRP